MIALKTNRLESILASKKDIAGWLIEGAGIYFFNKYLPTWKQGVVTSREERKNQRTLLNYTLGIEHIIDADPTKVVDHTRPTVYLHGWGDTKNSAKLIKANCDVLPGDIVTFNFRDAGVILAKWRYSNLGQLPDVLSALYAIKWTKDNTGAKAIDLFGYSRGGATLLNTLAVLNDDSGAYDADLQRIGITAQERSEILTLLQRGCHVLDCPLTDMNVTINEFIKHKKIPIKNESNSFWIKAFQAFTRYKKDGLQGLSSAQSFTNLHLNILMHFQHRDTIVSNKNEAELYKHLYQSNPNTTYMVLGNNGGHLHSHAALAHTVHSFKKKFGGSYDPEYVAQYDAIKNTIPVGNRLLQPGMCVEDIIALYYKQCHEADSKKKKHAA